MHSKVKRRQFLKWSVSSGAVAGLAACGTDGLMQPGGTPSADATTSGDGAQGMDTCEATRNDALGPFFEAGAPARAKIATDSEAGDRLIVNVQVVDQACDAITGVLIDIWQADKDGAYFDAGSEYRLRGQVMTDEEGRFTVDTIRPGAYMLGPDAWRPAHLHFMFAKPGFSTFATQLYFAGDQYLSPDDGCGSCGSDDTARIIDLTRQAQGPWMGSWRAVLTKS